MNITINPTHSKDKPLEHLYVYILIYLDEYWPINDTIWNEEEESVPSGIFIPKSDFAPQKKSLKERIEDGFRRVFCCKHQTKQERVWCHDSCNDNEEIELDSSPVVNYPTGRVIKFEEGEKRVIEIVKPKTRPFGFCIAKKKLKNSNGVFVTRIQNFETFISLTGILDPGDEILEIDSVSVSRKNIKEIRNMITNTDKIRFTTRSF
ncbi:uncharacterized protein LOC143250382 [Tachypleus tridentatus]|uniref:uncharacterized protein LOC143250382 n=1 Tax=Tachypleus tridentatus TaxID=6853 RepID=UPI003FD503D7